LIFPGHGLSTSQPLRCEYDLIRSAAGPARRRRRLTIRWRRRSCSYDCLRSWSSERLLGSPGARDLLSSSNRRCPYRTAQFAIAPAQCTSRGPPCPLEGAPIPPARTGSRLLPTRRPLRTRNALCGGAAVQSKLREDALSTRGVRPTTMRGPWNLSSRFASLWETEDIPSSAPTPATPELWSISATVSSDRRLWLSQLRVAERGEERRYLRAVRALPPPHRRSSVARTRRASRASLAGRSTSRPSSPHVAESRFDGRPPGQPAVAGSVESLLEPAVEWARASEIEKLVCTSPTQRTVNQPSTSIRLRRKACGVTTSAGAAPRRRRADGVPRELQAVAVE